MATLEEVMATLYSAGEPMPGSCMSDDEALAYARQHLVYGGYCLVRNWRWLDLKVTESQRLMLAKTRRQPACGFHADSDTHSTRIRTVIPR